MALRNIVKRGDPVLEKSCREVTDFDQRLHTLLDDMRETVFHANGVGLAAPQVGVLRRVALVIETNVAEGEEEKIIELVNPVILEEEGEQEGVEGCLSVPGLVGMVTRPKKVRVRAQNRNGKWFEVQGEGLTARAFCHELEHLDGKLYTRLCDTLYDPDDLPELAELDETESE